MSKPYNRLQTSKELEKLMKNYYFRQKIQPAVKALTRRKLAWITSGAPVELLRAFDIDIVYPENYGALCGARRAASALSRVAEERGYSMDLCSYARSNIGSVLQPDLAPLKGLPRPDLLVVCNNICGTVLKWYEVLARHFQIPLFILDTPFVAEELTPHALSYVETQLRRLAEELEKLTGVAFREEKLQKILSYSNETVSLWGRIRAMGQHRPSPINAPDLFTSMAPIVVLRGTPKPVTYYRNLLDELETRVQNGQGALKEEKYRLLWDNIAIWHRLFRFYGTFAAAGACFVVDTYTGGWSMEINEQDPFRGMAKAYAGIFLNQSLEYRVKQMTDLIRDYQVDGFVMHSNRSCKSYSLVQEEIRRRVMDATGVRGLVIESDMADDRVHADEPVNNRIQAFLESL